VQPGVFADDAKLRARLGRVTLDVGSRRLIARHIFRNTINAFDGVVVDWQQPKRHRVHVFAVAPVQRLPDTPDGLEDNAFEFDAPQFDSWLFGAIGSFTLDPGFKVDGYLYSWHRDPAGTLVTPGFRLVRPAARRALDVEMELAVQMGETDGQTHQAAFGHLSVGYTFGVRGLPRVRLMYDWASGDRDPDDDRNNRFDPMFGVARPLLGPTGLYTAFTRRNLNAPGLRVSGRLEDAFDAFVVYRFMFLDQPRDAWTSSGLRDATGAAGDAVGRQLEVRVRWHILPKQVSWDSGFAWLDRGDMPETVAPDAGDPFFVYTQLIWSL
jgi:hypothetical protein